MGDTKAHAPFPPSASHRWTVCTHSHKPPVPEQSDSPASIEGTDAHFLAEKVMTSVAYPWPPVEFFVGSKVTLPSGAKVTKVMANHVQRYVDYVDAHFRANGGKLFIEQRVEMSKIDPRFWGSADVIHITKYNRLHIFDLKYGLWPVEADDNEQGKSYALGALTKYRDQIDLTGPVTFHICQPRAAINGEFMRSTKFSIDELVKFGNLARRAIWQSDHDPKYVEGEHCKFCPKELICPELNKLGRKAFT